MKNMQKKMHVQKVRKVKHAWEVRQIKRCTHKKVKQKTKAYRGCKER